MKVIVEVEDKDVVLLLGVAKGNGFKRENPLTPYSDKDKQDALRFLFAAFIKNLQQKTVEKLLAQREQGKIQ